MSFLDGNYILGDFFQVHIQRAATATKSLIFGVLRTWWPSSRCRVKRYKTFESEWYPNPNNTQLSYWHPILIHMFFTPPK